MRRTGIAALWLAGAVLIGLFGLGRTASVGLAFAYQAATPADPAQPAAEATVAPEVAPAAATPGAAPAEAAPPAASATTDIVTLIVWYQNDVSNEFINVLPLGVDAGFVAGPQADAAPIGRAEFPDPSVGPPTVTIGDTVFTAYLRFEGDVYERWTWENDEESNRPGTLVLQVAGVGGAYQDYFGTATFVSRDEDGVGGPLILALQPPIPSEAAAEPAADEAPAEDVPVEDVPAAAAPVEEAPVENVDPGTEIGGDEGEVPAPDPGTETEEGA